MQSFDHTFEGFPRGTVVDRVDGPSCAIHSSRRVVHVTLSPLRAESATELRIDRRDMRVVLIDVAGLPFFAVGDIVHDKRLERVGITASARSVCDFAPGERLRPSRSLVMRSRVRPPFDLPTTVRSFPVLIRRPSAVASYPLPSTPSRPRGTRVALWSSTAGRMVALQALIAS